MHCAMLWLRDCDAVRLKTFDMKADRISNFAFRHT
jgi:hypothetical protein